MPGMTVVVLQEDIDEALADPRLGNARAQYCPVARAAGRALGVS
jgi:hypothetical protein